MAKVPDSPMSPTYETYSYSNVTKGPHPVDN